MSHVAYVGGQIASQISDSSLMIAVREVVPGDRGRGRIVYLQITRSGSSRDHALLKPVSRRSHDWYLADVAAA
jgi:hypothetical protein